MAANHTTTKSQRDARKAEVARLHARGYTHDQIAQQLAMTKQNVSYWLKQVDTEAAALIADLAEVKRRELLMLAEAEREVWDAWEQSRQDAETITERTFPDGTTQLERRREGQSGDAALIKRLIEISERRAKLLGIDAPTKQEILGEVVKVYAGFDPDKV